MKSKREQKKWMYIVAAACWILIWQVVAMLLKQEILLVSPISVCKRLFVMIQTLDFWQSVGYTLLRIVLGFLLSVSVGITLAFFSFFYSPLEIFLKPVLRIMKTAPVASIIIVILIWISSKNLSFIISFFVAFPIIYTNVLKGLDERDESLDELMEVYQLGIWKKLRYLYLRSILPYLQSGISLGIGMSIKASIAAEIIGLPNGSVGERMYQAKIYLNTPDLFAWTVVVIAFSVLLEWLVKRGMKGFVNKMQGNKRGDAS